MRTLMLTLVVVPGAAAVPAAAAEGGRGAPDAAQVRARAAVSPVQAAALPLRRLHVAS